MPSPQVSLTSILESHNYRNANTYHQHDAQHRRTPFIMIADRLPLLDPIHAPKEDGHAVEQRNNRHDGECYCGRQGYRVTEVEQGGSDGSEDDREGEL